MLEMELNLLKSKGKKEERRINMVKREKKEEDVEAYWHEAVTRKNAVPVGLASYDTSKPKKYEYHSHF